MTSLLTSRTARTTGALVGLGLCVCLLLASVVYGLMDTSWQTAVDAYTEFDGTNEQIVIRDVRVPRALIAAAVGASLGLAGLLMQALTRNPLSDPGIFGINAGAAFCLVVAVVFFGVSGLHAFAWVAFAGSALSSLVVYGLGATGRDGLSPLKITLAGAAVTALFSSFTHGLLVMNERALEEVLFWLAGSVAGRDLAMLGAVLPYFLVAWIGALLVAGQLNTLQLGEDVAQGLGQKLWLVKLLTGLLIVLLAGGSVAVAGPIGFVGLVIPHLTRALVGLDLRWGVLYSALLGAMLLLAADLAARFIAMPKEMPLGVMTALVGVPFFIAIARKGRRA